MAEVSTQALKWLEKPQVRELFESHLGLGAVQRFKKVGRVISRPVVPGETIITIVSGKVETLRRVGADVDFFVVRNIEPGAYV
jgi:hypothetical protein